MRAFIFFIILVLPAISYSKCKDSENLAHKISFKFREEGVKNLIQNMYGNELLDMRFYSDIIAGLGQGKAADERRNKEFESQLDKNFSCQEINELNRFADSKVGESFFRFYNKTIYDADNYSIKEAKSYLERFQKKVRERNFRILTFLRQKGYLNDVSMTEIIVAKVDLKAGALITKNDLTNKNVVAAYVSSYYLPSSDEAALLGKHLIKNLKTGDPILLRFLK